MDILHLLSSRSFVEPWSSLSLNLSSFLASMIPLLPCFPHYLPGSSSVVLSFSLFLKSWYSRGLHSIPVNLYSFYSPGFTLTTLKASATIYMLMIFKPTSLAYIFSPEVQSTHITAYRTFLLMLKVVSFLFQNLALLSGNSINKLV